MRLAFLSILSLAGVFFATHISKFESELSSGSYAKAVMVSIPLELKATTPNNRVHPMLLHAAALSFVRAYPTQLEKYENHKLYFKDGTSMGFNPRISSSHFHALMSKGRLNLEDFFKKVYGENESAVVQNLQRVKWLPQSKGLNLSFTSQCGAAESLRKVSSTLDTMPNYYKYLSPCSGTFVWRPISGSGRLSNHSFGIAIDINSKYGDYWRWAPEFKNGEPLKFRNRVPMEIVNVFENNGFVWGGRWPHYDTMHFEFHPEVRLYNKWFKQSKFNKQNNAQ